MWLIPMLVKHSVQTGKYKIPLKEENILLTLVKIKLNDTFALLADKFGISTSQACRKFKNTVKVIAKPLKKLIFFFKCATS